MFTFFTQKKTVAVHSGSFHADDVFACATLSLVFDGKIRIIRTRDQSIIEKADIVVDVGGIYDPDHDRFDHHQIGGAGVRDNGIPYASFGLVWKKYGERACGSNATALRIDTTLVCPIDGVDNGIDIAKPLFRDVGFYTIHNIIASFAPTWKEKDMSTDEQFLKAVAFAETLLAREITKTNDAIESRQKIEHAYQTAEDKRILVLDENYPWGDVIKEHPEILFVVAPSGSVGNWGVKTVRADDQSLVNKKDLPRAWGGLRDKELQDVTGVPDAVFCHTKLFLVVAQSKEGALRLAMLALNTN